MADPVKTADVKGFLSDAEKAKPTDTRSASLGAKLTTREDRDNVMIEAVDEKSKTVVHRSYVKKP